jgi:glycosyltransferase involved in cell wall biosynthesis
MEPNNKAEPARRGGQVLALIPAYNEAARVAAVVSGAHRYLPVLVLDDGSRDATGEQARRAGAEVLRQEPNQGKGVALKTGFRHALEQDYQAVITLDADGQHDPAEIPKFLEVFREQEVDLVIGARDFGQIPGIRRLSNTIGRLSLSWALNQEILDNQSGYRLVSRRLMETMLHSQEARFEFEVDMIVESVVRGYRIAWVPIRTIYAGESSHIQPLRHVYHYFRMVWRAYQAVRRARRQTSRPDNRKGEHGIR